MYVEYYSHQKLIVHAIYYHQLVKPCVKSIISIVRLKLRHNIERAPEKIELLIHKIPHRYILIL